MDSLETTYKGYVSDLMAQGFSRTYTQPWYQPLSFTPENTGIALGGIGSTCLTTPFGSTPVFNFISGHYVKESNIGDIRLNNFFFREKILSETEHRLSIYDFSIFSEIAQLCRLVQENGQLVFDGTESRRTAEEKLNRLINDRDFCKNNKTLLQNLQADFSPRILYDPETRPESYKTRNYNLLLDIFMDSVSENPNSIYALTGDICESCISDIVCYPCTAMYYEALYPFTLTRYTARSHSVKIKKLQYSPIIPGDEMWCSTPVIITEWDLENESNHVLDLGLIQTQENFCGYYITKERPSSQDSGFLLVKSPHNQTNTYKTCRLDRQRILYMVEFGLESGNDPGDFRGRHAIAICTDKGDNAIRVSCKPCYYTKNEPVVLKSALAAGQLKKYYELFHYCNRESLSGALYVNVILKPYEKKKLYFGSVFDFPYLHLGHYNNVKKYVYYYPDSKNRCLTVLKKTLQQSDDLKEAAHRGQETMYKKASTGIFSKCANASRLHYCTMALNSLSYIAEASVWDKDNNFLIKECIDYPFFNSVDVYFYGSYGLLHLLPELDKQIITQIARAVFQQDNSIQRYHFYYYYRQFPVNDPAGSGSRFLRGSVPHDFGSVFDMQPNAYIWKNVHSWKDLASYFILLVYRKYIFDHDRRFLMRSQRSVQYCIAHAASQMDNALCLPLMSGTGDTYDNLFSYGISVYSSALWLAALKATLQMTALFGDKKAVAQYRAHYETAERNFHDFLWDETAGYYHHYATPVTQADLKWDHREALQTLLTTLGISVIPPDKCMVTALINRFITDADATHVYKHASGIKNYLEHAKYNRLSIEPPNPTKRELRILKKVLLFVLGRECFTENFEEKMFQDSDDVFGMQLSADYILALLKLEPVTPADKQKRILKKILEVNGIPHTSVPGVSNLVKCNGQVLENFQAQEIWIGMQYAVIGSLLVNDMQNEALNLLDLLYRSIYERIKLPFAVPEGLNTHYKLMAEDLANGLNIPEENALRIREMLMEAGILKNDFTINPITYGYEEFNGKILQCGEQLVFPDIKKLYVLIVSYSLQYTACKYFRPGMIMSLLSIG